MVVGYSAISVPGDLEITGLPAMLPPQSHAEINVAISRPKVPDYVAKEFITKYTRSSRVLDNENLAIVRLLTSSGGNQGLDIRFRFAPSEQFLHVLQQDVAPVR